MWKHVPQSILHQSGYNNPNQKDEISAKTYDCSPIYAFLNFFQKNFKNFSKFNFFTFDFKNIFENTAGPKRAIVHQYKLLNLLILTPATTDRKLYFHCSRYNAQAPYWDTICNVPGMLAISICSVRCNWLAGWYTGISLKLTRYGFIN